MFVQSMSILSDARSMTTRTAVYGDVISPEDRQRFDSGLEGGQDELLWFDQPKLFEAGDCVSVVYVDLDSPKFSEASFLVSLATAGEGIRLIGKTDSPNQPDTARVAKLGVSEVIDSSEALQRIDKILAEAEKTSKKGGRKANRFGLDAVIGESTGMSEIRKSIEALSLVDFPSALILGSTGTGKGLIAKVLHHTGARQKHNMVEVNCSAIPDELFESELFGHAKGAFTDAKNEKMGLFEYAANGTIFLDEVGNLSASAQAKLLKVLEDKKLRRVGDIDERDCDVRVLAATNLDLEQAIHEKRFREDLYFRLSLLTLKLPSLSDRPNDVRQLAEHYLEFYGTIYDKPGLNLADSAINEMEKYSWPGNVRELCNVVERAVLLATGKVIGRKDVVGSLNKGRVGIAERRQFVVDIPPQGISLEEAEQSIVRQVLDLFKWNRTETAKFLRISRPRLRRIMEAGRMEQDRRNR